MRAYFRVAPRFGISMPWWLAILAFLMWITAALMYWLVMACFVAGVYAWQAAARGWASRHTRTPPA